MQKQLQTVKSQQTSQDNRNYFGDILYLLTMSEFHHHWKMHQVKRVFVPPMYHGQYRIWYNNTDPFGFCLWAWVSDEILEKLLNENYRMQADDWQSGKNLYLAEFVAPFGNTRQIVRNMRKFVKENFGENVKGHWYRSAKKKVGSAMSGKKVA